VTVRYLLTVLVLTGCGNGIRAKSSFDGARAQPTEPILVATAPKRAHTIAGRVQVVVEPTKFFEHAVRSGLSELKRRGGDEGCDALQLIASQRRLTCEGVEQVTYDAFCLRWSAQ
jgi:hypothetical protein